MFKTVQLHTCFRILLKYKKNLEEILFLPLGSVVEFTQSKKWTKFQNILDNKIPPL
jgi:hypothetical protein